MIAGTTVATVVSERLYATAIQYVVNVEEEAVGIVCHRWAAADGRKHAVQVFPFNETLGVAVFYVVEIACYNNI